MVKVSNVAILKNDEGVIKLEKCPKCGYWVAWSDTVNGEHLCKWCATEGIDSDGFFPPVEEVICPVCHSIVRLYDGNKIGVHMPHQNVNEAICKMAGVEITPRL